MFVAVCCSVLHCVALRCNVLQSVHNMNTAERWYGVATMSRLFKIPGLFCRI